MFIDMLKLRFYDVIIDCIPLFIIFIFTIIIAIIAEIIERKERNNGKKD